MGRSRGLLRAADSAGSAVNNYHVPVVETLQELLEEKAPKTVNETCEVVRDWLVVRSAMAFELGGGDVANILDRAAAAAVR